MLGRVIVLVGVLAAGTADAQTGGHGGAQTGGAQTGGTQTGGTQTGGTQTGGTQTGGQAGAQPGAQAGAQPGAPSSMVRRPTLTLDGARKVLSAAEASAQLLQSPSSIAVVDAEGVLLAFERMDGGRVAGNRLAIGEARSAARYERPTEDIEQAINGGRLAAITAGGVQLQGGVPIRLDGVVIGAIGVSGFDKVNDVQAAEAGAAAIR
ncbi:MAG: heme-binding protein [Acidisphaera sp.]|nr:heme-binding protein [Acidisphaera sp.]